MTWRARVVEDFPMLAVRVHLADVGDHRSHFIVRLGPGRETIMSNVENGIEGPDGLSLPREAVEPLRDALDAFLGKRPDDYRAKYEEARDALEVERARIDAVLRNVLA